MAPSSEADRRRLMLMLMAMAAFAAMRPVATLADVIVTTFLTAKQELPTATQLTTGTTTSITGTETFNTRTLRAAGAGATLTTDFGTSGDITGAFTGNFGIVVKDQYGGAGDTGRYITTSSPTGFSIKFGISARVRGVNYFGIDITALDGSNEVALYRENVLLQSFSAVDFRVQLGTCPDSRNLYCGNPTTGANPNEQYAFLNIFDLSGYFDEVRIRQASGGGFEADNVTVGFRELNEAFGAQIAVRVPAPASAMLVLPALLALAGLRRRAVRAGAATAAA